MRRGVFLTELQLYRAQVCVCLCLCVCLCYSRAPRATSCALPCSAHSLRCLCIAFPTFSVALSVCAFPCVQLRLTVDAREAALEKERLRQQVNHVVRVLARHSNSPLDVSASPCMSPAVSVPCVRGCVSQGEMRLFQFEPPKHLLPPPPPHMKLLVSPLAMRLLIRLGMCVARPRVARYWAHGLIAAFAVVFPHFSTHPLVRVAIVDQLPHTCVLGLAACCGSGRRRSGWSWDGSAGTKRCVYESVCVRMRECV